MLTLAQMTTIVADNVTADVADIPARHFNTAQVDISRYTKRRKTSTVAAADGVFTLPSVCLILKAVAWAGKALEPYGGDILPTIPTGTPRYYMQLDNTIYLIPKLGGNASIVFVPRPADLVQAADTSELKDAEDALIALATQKWYEEDPDSEEEAVWWKQLADERITAWVELDSQRHYQRAKVRSKAMSSYMGRW